MLSFIVINYKKLDIFVVIQLLIFCITEEFILFETKHRITNRDVDHQ